jgi:hypothetical protein
LLNSESVAAGKALHNTSIGDWIGPSMISLSRDGMSFIDLH